MKKNRKKEPEKGTYVDMRQLKRTEVFDGAIRLSTPDAAKIPVYGILPEDTERRVAGARANLGDNDIFHVGSNSAFNFYIIGNESDNSEKNIMIRNSYGVGK